MKEDKRLLCPHCGQQMKKWKTPPFSTWSAEFQYVCFNDECPYLVKGWKWMLEKYNVHSSYRHRHDPETEESGPLPVWSHSALKGDIIGEDEKD